MLRIKRYPNRKLYNTAAKEYISLEGIAALIAQGEEVQVIDHASGEDLTSLTLMQIVLEEQKKRHHSAHDTLLLALRRGGESRLAALLRSLLTNEVLDELLGQHIERLMQEGRLSAAQGNAVLSALFPSESASPPPATEDSFLQQQVAALLAAHQIPTRQDILRLAEQIDELAARLDALPRS